MATPSAISSVSHSERSCSSSVTSRPAASVRAGRRACWSSSSASSPRASGSAVASVSCRARRMASRGQVVSPAVPGVVDEREHAQHDGQITGFAEVRSRRLRFARLIRCAIVASGTKKASAISRVDRPPTARRVSAICEAGESTGWQHQNSRSSVSSPCSVGPWSLPTRSTPHDAVGPTRCAAHRPGAGSRPW